VSKNKHNGRTGLPTHKPDQAPSAPAPEVHESDTNKSHKAQKSKGSSPAKKRNKEGVPFYSIGPFMALSGIPLLALLLVFKFHL